MDDTEDFVYAKGNAKRPGLYDCVITSRGASAQTPHLHATHAWIVKSLQFPQAARACVLDDAPGEGTSQGDPFTGQWRRFSYATYQYFRDTNQSFQEVSAFRSGEARLSVRGVGLPGEMAQRGHLVSGNYFSVLGVNAMLGRTLTAEDDKPGAPPAAVMSHGSWTQQWKSDPFIITKEIVVNGTSFTVVGVMPPSFFGVRVRRTPDFWLPLAFNRR